MGITLEISKIDKGYEVTIFAEDGYPKTFECSTRDNLVETITDYIKYNDYFKEVK